MTAQFDQAGYRRTNLLIVLLSALAGGVFLSQFGGTYAIVGMFAGIATSTYLLEKAGEL